jgi:hypothetical protein
MGLNSYRCTGFWTDFYAAALLPLSHAQAPQAPSMQPSSSHTTRQLP